MRTYIDYNNSFFELFNPRNGYYYRSGVLKTKNDIPIGELTDQRNVGREKWLCRPSIVDSGKDPFMRNFPALIDIGIMGSCKHGRTGMCNQSQIQCYQNGAKYEMDNMSFENFTKIIDQCRGKVFQVALGGRGDVDQHPDFEKILGYSVTNDVIPSFTTSGLGLNERHVKVCKSWGIGAVAVSDYDTSYMRRSLEMLVEAGITTNVHYVLNNDTIQHAICNLINAQLYPSKVYPGINAIIFLLHKPVGQGTIDKVLDIDDPKVKEFFELIDTQQFPFDVGFDSCSSPGIVNLTKNISSSSIDYCEAARFSCYIDAQINMMPCSFGSGNYKYYVNLDRHTIQEAWNSEIFEDFRNILRDSCPECPHKELCGGGCPIVPDITLCDREERD